MYDGTVVIVRTYGSLTSNFSIRIGLYQGFALGAFIFSIMIDNFKSNLGWNILVYAINRWCCLGRWE